MTTRKELNNLSDLSAKEKPNKKRGGKRADHEGSIYYWKTRKLWVASIRLGINPKTGKDVRKKKYAHSQQEALAALEELKLKYATVTDFSADTITFGEWIEKWLDVYVAPKVRENTLVGYQYHLREMLDAIGHIRLCKVTEFDLQQVIWKRLRDKVRTAQIARVLVRAAFRKAIKCHLLNASPAEDLELPPKPARRTFQKPSMEDWQKLLEHKGRVYYGWRYIILTEYVTGTRISELLALRWEDIVIHKDEQGRITGGTMHIQHSLYPGLPKDGTRTRPLYLGETKTQKGNRYLSLPVSYCYELQRYRKLQLEQRLKMGNWPDNDFVFTRQDGTPISPQIFSNYFGQIRKKLGIATTFHMLRHDMATRMKSSQQFDMKDIQEQLGHSTIQVTMDIYTHIDEERKKQVSNWLEEGMDKLLNLPQNSTTTHKTI